MDICSAARFRRESAFKRPPFELVLWVAIGMMLGPLTSPAQEAPLGGIQGVVVERAGGAAVPGAVIEVEGTALRAVANAVGRFSVRHVPAAETTVVVQAPGFLKLRVPGLRVNADEPLELRVELEATPNLMERIQVTATKSALSIGEVPAQTDIVDRETIDRRGDHELTQALAHIPGLVISTQAGSFESVALRGMPRDGNEFTNTLLLIDGVPQTDSRNSARVVNLPINDADSIEVVRGPNSALYGRTAVGGAINVLTASPTPEHRFGVDFTGGEFGTLKGLGRASGPIGRRVGYYVSIAREHNGGYFTGPIDFNVDETAAFGKLTFAPDRKSFGSVSINGVVSDNSTPTNVPIIGGNLLSDLDPRFQRRTSLNFPGPNYHQEETRFTVNYTRELAERVRVIEVFGYRPIRYEFIDDGDVIGGPFDLEANTLSMFPFELETNEDIFYQEVRLEAAPRLGSVKSALIVGGSYEQTGGFSSGNLIFTDPDLFGWTLNYLNPIFPPRDEWRFFRFGGNDYNLGITGLLAQYRIEPTSRWVMTVGGRYDRLALDNTLTFRDGDPRVEDTFDAFSPKISSTFRLMGVEDDSGPTVNAYATYSQAFLPPRRPSQLRPSDEQIELIPEDIDNYEAGIKGSVLDGRLSFEGAYFQMHRDGIVTTVRQGSVFLPTNAGEHKYKGFETAVRWRPTRKLTAYLNASFYRNRFDDFVIEASSGDTVLTGNRLPISPDRVINGGAVFSPRSFLDFTLDVKHVGTVQIDQRNTFELDPYTLVDAAVTWRRGPLRLTLAAHNLFDTEYFWNGDISSGQSADIGRPRQVLVTTAFVF